MKLRDKVAIITGGSKGIGLGCARVFAGHGATVVIGARGQADGKEAEKKLTDAGHTALFVPCNVSVEADLRRLVETTIERFGKLNCMVNNAGWHPPETKIDDIGLEDFERLVRWNLTSTFLGCKLAVPHLRKTRGCIVNVSSAVGLMGQDLASSYCATKAGQIGLTKALAVELARDGVRVNAVCPAGVQTPLMMEWVNAQPDPKAALELADRAHPLGRMATIEEIGEVCAFLASDEASFITGQEIAPDGGIMLGYRR